MKKLLLLLLSICLLLVCGCSSSKTDVGEVENDTNTETISDNSDNGDFVQKDKNDDMYESLFGVRTDGKFWYISQPYLNEISLGAVRLLANGDDWWIGTVKDSSKQASNVNDSKDLILDVFFKTIEGYFYLDDKGFIETSTNNEKHSGLDMIKVEGSATNGKFEVIGECWIYGYIFMLGDTPAGVIGMNNKDKTEEAKATIKNYVDAMVDTLVLK